MSRTTDYRCAICGGGVTQKCVCKTPCKHERISPPFDPVEAKSLSAYEIRRRWPRYSGPCPDCRQNVIVYASTEHYVSGDW